MKLNLIPLEKALATLREALTEYDKNRSNDFVRDSCIQRFEYSYELSWKMLKRYLELTEGSSITIDHMPFAEMIRTASERGLLRSGWDRWSVFRDTRNKTSHAYNKQMAIEVHAEIPDFLIEAEHLLATLKKANDVL